MDCSAMDCSLLDDRYLRGIYRGTERHVPDIEAVIKRANQQGLARIIITAGTVEESRQALKYARQWNERYQKDWGLHFSCTVGVHPTRCSQVFEAEGEKTSDALLQELYDLCVDGLRDGTVVAYGELGLDYDRLEFCSMPIQKQYLLRQLKEVAIPLNLPLFLHNRNAQSDLLDLLGSLAASGNGTFRGVVHSFDDTLELAQSFIDQLGLYIGINGCSLRTQENLDTVRQLPLERIVLETE
jgi:TatD DNase family protein